ncbi:predicted protein, partial [Haematococcus lacustris]
MVMKTNACMLGNDVQARRPPATQRLFTESVPTMTGWNGHHVHIDGNTGVMRLPGVIGQGSFGVVYKGTWKGLTVAVKTLVFTSLPSMPISKQQQRAMTEAAICRALQHPNIVATYAYELQVSPGCQCRASVADLNPSAVLLAHAGLAAGCCAACGPHQCSGAGCCVHAGAPRSREHTPHLHPALCPSRPSRRSRAADS